MRAAFLMIIVATASAAADLSEARVRRPPASTRFRGAPPELPGPPKPWGTRDLRSTDLRALDLRGEREMLLLSDFNTATRWPPSRRMPAEPTPETLLRAGRDPGLRLRTLHSLGITGEGVHIGVIDQPLLLEHEEYADRMEWYREEENVRSYAEASMHGSAVVSLAAGRTCGVAPGARIHFVATYAFDESPKSGRDYSFKARALRRLVARSAELPEDQKIRVISMSFGWSEGQPGYEEMEAAVAEARDAGIFLVSSSLPRTYGFQIQGVGRDPLRSADDRGSYHVAFFPRAAFEGARLDVPRRLLFPMGSRSFAAPQGPSAYAFNRAGSWSWMVPWIAGLYALALQVDPAITPKRFWEVALETARPMHHDDVDGRPRVVGRLVEPVHLVGRLARDRRR